MDRRTGYPFGPQSASVHQTGPDTVVLRVSPRERGHLVIQIGTSDADRAIRVAKMVCNLFVLR